MTVKMMTDEDNDDNDDYDDDDDDVTAIPAYITYCHTRCISNNNNNNTIKGEASPSIYADWVTFG